MPHGWGCAWLSCYFYHSLLPVKNEQQSKRYLIDAKDIWYFSKLIRKFIILFNCLNHGKVLVLASESPVRKKHETGSQKACLNLAFASNTLCVALGKCPQKRSSNPCYLMNTFTESLKDFKNKFQIENLILLPAFSLFFTSLVFFKQLLKEWTFHLQVSVNKAGPATGTHS